MESPSQQTPSVDEGLSHDRVLGGRIVLLQPAQGYRAGLDAALLGDAINGDATLFAHRDGVEATWSLMTPILKAWANDPIRDLPNYAAGTWGPATADAMMKGDGRRWRKL